jgi:phosphohistidine phosphatase
MKIYIVQHGKAKSEEEDPGRPINEEGINETEKIAQEMEGKIHVSKIYCSKKLRAQQTAEIFAKHIEAKVESVDGLKPMDDIGNAIDMIEENVMFVGHLPYLSKLVSKLLTGNQEPETVNFTYSGVLCLEKDEIWRLVFYELP